MIKNLLVTVGIIVALGLGAIGAFGHHSAEPTQLLGAVSSPDIMSPYFSVGGVVEWKAHTITLTQASTTVCAIQSPAATSTLSSANILFSVSSTTASTVTLAQSTTPYATTTSLGSITLAANARGQALASTTGVVFSPNTYFVVSMTGGIGTFSPTGVCQASWQQLAY